LIVFGGLVGKEVSVQPIIDGCVLAHEHQTP
jgi:hypothetical protein